MRTTFLLLVSALATCAQEPAQFIYETIRERVPVAGQEAKVTKMDVIDRTEKGTLVQLFTTKQERNAFFDLVDVRINGPQVFVLGMVNDVGSRVGETKLYKMETTITHKGTVYSVFTFDAPPTEYKVVDHDIPKVNPLWTVWAEQQKAKIKAGKSARIFTFRLQQASNGSPSFQFEVGKQYLTGDGVETNLALARHWLQAACTNGESQASNLLMQAKSK